MIDSGIAYFEFLIQGDLYLERQRVDSQEDGRSKRI